MFRQGDLFELTVLEDHIVNDEDMNVLPLKKDEIYCGRFKASMPANEAHCFHIAFGKYEHKSIYVEYTRVRIQPWRRWLVFAKDSLDNYVLWSHYIMSTEAAEYEIKNHSDGSMIKILYDKDSFSVLRLDTLERYAIIDPW